MFFDFVLDKVRNKILDRVNVLLIISIIFFLSEKWWEFVWYVSLGEIKLSFKIFFMGLEV